MIDIRPIRNVETLKQAIESAKSDDHALLAPTHVVLKENVLIGALDIVPCAFVWMHTKFAKNRDSLHMLNTLESMMANQSQGLVVPCMETSPYYPIMPSVGFIPLPHKLFMKGLS